MFIFVGGQAITWDFFLEPVNCERKILSTITKKSSVKPLFCLLQICYHNKYEMMPLGVHGGSYPYASVNTDGGTATNDYCMAVGVTAKGSTAHGWTQNGNAYDSPSSDSDWPNRSLNHLSPHLTVWLK